jgi:uncharacterized membrane protein
MTDLEAQVENQFKSLQFSKEFTDLVAENTHIICDLSSRRFARSKYRRSSRYYRKL